MKKNNQYLKIVEWSPEDQCYVGTAPGLIIGGVHGPNQLKVFKELCLVVDRAVLLLKKEGKNLPPVTAGKKYSGKILLRVSSSIHKLLSIQALQEGTSINKIILQKF